MAGYIGKDSSGVILAETDPNSVPKTGGSFTGAVTVDETSASPLTLDRNSTDGSIVTLQKDGTTVGSIGTYSGYLNIANDSNGLALGDTVIYPSDASAGGTDGVVDLGGSSARFKDLYLSGGVYLGGTGSANYLDDYEEGTWTPVNTVNGFSESISSVSGTYIKIGNTVTVTCYVSLSASGYPSSYSRFSGLPFTPVDNFNGSAGNGGLSAGFTGGTCRVGSSTNFDFYKSDSTVASTAYWGTVTYFV